VPALQVISQGLRFGMCQRNRARTHVSHHAARQILLIFLNQLPLRIDPWCM
jgi:hypothetical protein